MSEKELILIILGLVVVYSTAEAALIAFVARYFREDTNDKGEKK